MRRAVLAAILLTFAVVTPVMAAPPPNDTPAGAIEVTIGTTVTQDTTEATADGFEESLNEFCGAPTVDSGVWFEFTATADGGVAFDASESDYAVGLMVFPATPTPDSLLTCGPGAVSLAIVAGETYTVLAFGDGESAATSGELVLTVREAIPAPDVELTIDPKATVNRAGEVRLTGTATCTSTDGSGSLIEVFGDISQRVGRLVIRGFFGAFLDIPCDGTTQAWEAFAVGDNGIFAGGKAATVAISFACTDVCTETFTEASIHLRRSGK